MQTRDLSELYLQDLGHRKYILKLEQGYSIWVCMVGRRHMYYMDQIQSLFRSSDELHHLLLIRYSDRDVFVPQLCAYLCFVLSASLSVRHPFINPLLLWPFSFFQSNRKHLNIMDLMLPFSALNQCSLCICSWNTGPCWIIILLWYHKLGLLSVWQKLFHLRKGGKKNPSGYFNQNYSKTIG